MGVISKFAAVTTLTTLATLTNAWLPEENKSITAKDGTNLFKSSNGKIRGVNLGSQFVFEPWIAESEWSDMGCGGKNSEFDCVSSLGQDAANTAFANHWASWTTQDDINEMVSYGLNTIRVPVGYWLREDIVDAGSEHFPQGGLDQLKKLCGWASDSGLYIIIDLHGAPGAQEAENAFTGQYASEPGFYTDYNYERALKWLEWMVDLVYQTDEMRNVGMLEIVNEPVQDEASASSMRSKYYPQAVERIRAAEQKLSVDSNDYLHIQTMDKSWGSGDPNEYLDDLTYMAYDDHRYIKWDTSVSPSHDNYISTSCGDNRDSNWPNIVGEWSLSVPDDIEASSDWEPSSNTDFYGKWFAAQVHSYEKQQGWIFWTWKSQLNDYRWSYQDAVKAGVIPKDLNSVQSVC
ncbi:CAZyme family GH5 [Penicillium psychrosexuale]|uniref:CAZyme family GH5 n=1 Tax=Penicillium psychrosexuale TaxID=1002107 RepID=UPI0025454368|nr:CAZyme family GH5 [Penicillium psychrosexuale]KAJ5791904.1 CAZyme family GH5 [Penicillium psychrosexuale]